MILAVVVNTVRVAFRWVPTRKNGPFDTTVVLILNIYDGLLLGDAGWGEYVGGATQRSKLRDDDDELRDGVQREVTAPSVEVVNGKFQFI